MDLKARAFALSVASALALMAVAPALAEDLLVTDQAAFSSALDRAEPGDRIVLADGEWRDFQVVLDAEGTKGAPITLAAQTPGGVRLTGRSNLAIGGEHLVVSGLKFTDGHSPTDAVVSFRLADGTEATDTRLTQTVIEDFSKPNRADQDSWVVLYGQDNTVDRNAFLGKTNRGPTLTVRLDAEQTEPSAHVIEANYFGPRPPLGGNGGETLRIGVSQTSDVDSGVTVRGNLFERASGEVEVVSIKAERNLVTENTFYESKGSVVFRHGGNNEVSRNVFLGNGVPDTGGIRVINDAQTVRDNYLEGLRGRKFLGALVVMNGVPDSPQNRYHQVTDAEIASNSFVDVVQMGFGVGTDDERSALPKDSRVADNLIVPAEGAELGLFDEMSGIAFEGNVATDEAFAPVAGTVMTDLTLARAGNGLRYPVGADVGAPRDLAVVSRDAVGPDHYAKPELAAPRGEVVRVAANEDALREAVAAAGPGDTLRLAGGEVAVAAPIEIDRPLTIEGASGGVTLLVAEGGLFSLRAGADLTLRGLGIIQESGIEAVLRAVGERYEGDYSLAFENVEAIASVNEAAPLLTADTETFATQVSLRSVGVRGWPGPVLSLGGDGLDGTYLAEDVLIADSAFEDVGGPVVTYGREGRDESTFGPRFAMTDTTLDGVAPGGDALVLGGIDGLDVSGNRVRSSGDVVVRRRVLGLPFSVGENTVEGDTRLDMTGVEGEPMGGSLTTADASDAAGGPSLVLTAEGAEAIRAADGLPPPPPDRL